MTGENIESRLWTEDGLPIVTLESMGEFAVHLTKSGNPKYYDELIFRIKKENPHFFEYILHYYESSGSEDPRVITGLLISYELLGKQASKNKLAEQFRKDMA